MPNKNILIGKIFVDCLSKDDLIKKISLDLSKNKKIQVATVNSEFVVTAENNLDFCESINSSKYRIADSSGILLAANYLSHKKWNNSIVSKIAAIIYLKYLLILSIIRPSTIRQPISDKISGSDFIYDLLLFAERKHLSVFLLGGAVGVAEKVSLIVQIDYPNLKIAGMYSGSPSVEDEQLIIDKINSRNSDLLFVAYGAPGQDLWIHRNLRKLKIKLAMGVGGTFDFIAGNIPRAPIWMRNHGLEWLYRFFRQPLKRLPRILNLYKFLLIVYRSRNRT